MPKKLTPAQKAAATRQAKAAKASPPIGTDLCGTVRLCALWLSRSQWETLSDFLETIEPSPAWGPDMKDIRALLQAMKPLQWREPKSET